MGNSVESRKMTSSVEGTYISTMFSQSAFTTDCKFHGVDCAVNVMLVYQENLRELQITLPTEGREPYPVAVAVDKDLKLQHAQLVPDKLYEVMKNGFLPKEHKDWLQFKKVIFLAYWQVLDSQVIPHVDIASVFRT